jgi:glycosyltransferase involved in cell wall biosynthesis
MKRILFVHSGKGLGGAPLTLLTIIRSLDRDRFSPYVLCLFESPATELFRRDGIETHIAKGIHHFAHTTGVWYPIKYLPVLLYRLLLFPFSIWNAYRFLKTHPFDFVHLNSSGLLAVAIAARMQRIPVLLHVLEHLHPGYFGMRRFILARLLTKFSDAVVFICNADAHTFPPSPKLHVIYDSVDPDEFDPEKVRGLSKSAFAMPSDSNVVGMLGGIHPIKGTLEFVEAAAKVVQEISNTHFVILGVLPERKSKSYYDRIIDLPRNWLSGERKYRLKVIAVANQELLKGKIHFIEPILDVPPVVKMLDVLVFPSTTPHYARPLIEAGLMKKPVVASRIGGPDEIVLDDVTGFLVTPRQPDELAQRIISLLRDPVLRTRMGEAGYQRAMKMFDTRKNVPKIIKLYDEMA